jgi:hypothetical protein
VADHEAVGAAGETSVGDEGDSLAEALAHDSTGGSEHLAHTGSALGSFVADDDDVAVLDLAVEDAAKGGLFGFVDDGLAGEGVALLAGDLGDGAFRGEVAAQDAQVAVSLDRIGEGTDDVLVGGVLAVVQNGDTINIDSQKNEINLDVPAAEIANRLKSWKASPCKEKRGTLAKYAKLVSSASEGAITDGD